MIVNRRTFILRQGRRQSAIEAIKATYARDPSTVKLRWYTSDIGPFDQLVMEMEFQDLAEYNKYWTAFDPGEDFWKGWFDLTATGGTNEIWEVVYQN